MVLVLLIYWSNEFDPTKRLERGVTSISSGDFIPDSNGLTGRNDR
jgi:hypothetical protein